jgi:hypothetical protein
MIKFLTCIRRYVVHLDEHPENIFYRVFQQIEAVPDYLDYFPVNAFTLAVERIKDYYTNSESMQLSLNHDYPYLSKFNMDAWLQGTSETLIELFKGRGIACPNPRPLSVAYSLDDA